MIVGLFLAESAGAQVPLSPKLLTPSSTRNVLAPPFSSWGNPGRDKDGNRYFYVGGFSDTEILRLSADASEGKTFKVSDQFPGASKFRFSDFAVTPGGDVYVLGGMEGKTMLLRFDDEGKLSEPITPLIPKSVTGGSIVATDARNVLFLGFYDNTAPADLKGKNYAAVLDTSGAVRQEMHLSVSGLDVANLANGEAPVPPGAALGDDGNFYFAGSNQILVIAQDGDLLWRIPFDNPYPKSRVTRLLVSGGMVIIALSHFDNHQGHNRYLVLLNSGGVVGYYEPSEQLGGWPAMCYSPDRGLTFLKVENRQVKLLTVPLR